MAMLCSMMHTIQNSIFLLLATNFLHPTIAYKYSVYNTQYSGDAWRNGGEAEPEMGSGYHLDVKTWRNGGEAEPELGSGYHLDVKTWRNVASLKHGAKCEASSEYNHNYKCQLVGESWDQNSG